MPGTDLQGYLHERNAAIHVATSATAGVGRATLIRRLLERSESRAASGDNRDFSTDLRRFTIADAPDHETVLDVVTGAAIVDVNVLVVDARSGVTTESRRQSYLASLLGIRRIVLAVNKMDLVAYSRDVFGQAQDEYLRFASGLGFADVRCIPITALNGDNVAQRSNAMPWYAGPSLVEYLQTVPSDRTSAPEPLRLPVHRIDTHADGTRAFGGVIASGSIAAGDPICIMPSGRTTRIACVLADDVETPVAGPGQAVAVTLDDEIDVVQGDVIAAANTHLPSADQFEATIVWMHEQPMLPGRSYLMQLGAQTVPATVAPLKYRINVDTLEHVAARRLDLNDIGVCGLELARAVVFERYAENPAMGGFVLIDRVTNEILGVGLLQFALRRSHNLHWQYFDVDKRARAHLKAQKPCVLWFTGLSGAGKSTIANLVEKRLTAMGRHTYLLDGDNVRRGLNKDLGFTEADRVENIRRIAEVARLMADAGLIVLVSFISPFRAERRMARELMEPGEFHEVFVDTPLEVAEHRDPKGLYKKARRGELKNFTGVDSPYETPDHPEIHLQTTTLSAEDAVEVIVRHLTSTGVIDER